MNIAMCATFRVCFDTNAVSILHTSEWCVCIGKAHQALCGLPPFSDSNSLG